MPNTSKKKIEKKLKNKKSKHVSEKSLKNKNFKQTTEKPFKKTLTFIKENRLRTFTGYFLDLIFYVIVVILLFNFIPTWVEQVNHSNDLIKDLSQHDFESMTNIVIRNEEIQQTKQNIEQTMFRLFIVLLTSANIIYALWASIILKKFTFSFISLFIIFSYLTQILLWIIYMLLINVKYFFVDISSESRLSVFLFIVICYFAYLKLFIFFVRNKDQKYSFKVLKEFASYFKTYSFFKVLLKYSLSCLIFVFLLIATHSPILLASEGIKIILTFALIVFVLIPYSTISKLYIVKNLE